MQLPNPQHLPQHQMLFSILIHSCLLNLSNTENVQFPKRKKGRFLKHCIVKKMQMLPDSELDDSVCSAKSSSKSGEAMGSRGEMLLVWCFPPTLDWQ